MARQRNADAIAKRRREKAAREQKITTIVAYTVAAIALVAVVALIVYSYTK
ncbi:MAG: hypothetical protein IJN86_04075 [Clostridia bacterium]|nr:hypothetical protein [Clostridia bacterium]MBQ7048106.1 hypothetical protein [Clostridia bacterium]